MKATLRAVATLGPSRAVRLAKNRAWSRHVSLGLRADLDRLPPRPKARTAVTMEPVDILAFEGFAAALRTEDDVEAQELLQRELLREGRVETLFVASSAQGHPVYAQWLVLPDGQERLHAATAGLYPRLGPEDALVEGAYTFPRFRGRAAMADGMWQLLSRAAGAGAARVYTYVSPDNVASLKGCARAGFRLDHVRQERRRVGRTRIGRTALDAAAEAAWTAVS